MSRFGATSEPSTSSSPAKSVTTSTLPADEGEWETIVVYTDGACKDNGKVGAVAGIGMSFSLLCFSSDVPISVASVNGVMRDRQRLGVGRILTHLMSRCLVGL